MWVSDGEDFGVMFVDVVGFGFKVVGYDDFVVFGEGFVDGI